MQINYAGKISRDEFLKALLLHSKQQYRVYKWILGTGAILFAFSVLYLAFQKSSGFDEVPGYLPGALIPLAIMTFPWWAPFLQLSAYNQKGNIYRNNIFGSIDDAGITINSTDTHVGFQWSVFDNYQNSKDLLMLYQGKNCFNLFTPGMFSSHEDWEKFISFAKEKVSANKTSA